MSEINAKMKANGYNPFGVDDNKTEQQRRKTEGWSVSSGEEEGEDGCLVALLRGICCCFYHPHPQPPLLSSSVVTHRKISRVVSTESLTKEGLAVAERPTYTHMKSREKLLHARAHHRLHSNALTTPHINTTTPEKAVRKPSTAGATPGDGLESQGLAAGPPHRPSSPAHPPASQALRSASQSLGSASQALRSANQPLGSASPTLGSASQALGSASPALRSASPVLGFASPALGSASPVLGYASPKGPGGLPITAPDSPRLQRTSRPLRPTQLSLAIQANRSKGSKTAAALDGSPSSTPSTPRSGSGSWGMMRTGFTSLMKAVTTTPRSNNHHQPPFTHSDEVDEGTLDEQEDDIPEAKCVRPATGGVDSPTRECYGSVTINILGRQGRWVRVVVCGLSGLPWVGGSGGLLLEVNVEPGARPRWMVLPHAHGPNVNVKLEAMVKGPRESKTKKRRFVKVSVWVCGRVWRHAAIGHALTPLTHASGPLTAPLHHHTQLTEDLGLVEVSLRCDYVDSNAEGGGPAQGEVTLTFEVLRARNLRPFHPGVLAKAAPSRVRDHVEVVCRVSLWVKGERVERESSMPVQLPVTQNPVIRSRSVFILQKDSLQHAAIILKVLYTCKWGGEDTVGRLQLGPLLYLGTLPEQASQAPTHDYKTSITLSHWGLALKTPGPTTMWHHLQL